jgi:hypothetical protein
MNELYMVYIIKFQNIFLLLKISGNAYTVSTFTFVLVPPN